MNPQSVNGIEGTGGQMAAAARKERGDEIAVKIDEPDERGNQDFPDDFRGSDS